MLPVKIAGVALIVISCSMAGFFKSRSVMLRGKKLSLFCDGLDLLFEHIEQGNCELDTAFKKSFSKCNFLIFEKTNAVCRDNDLDTEDKEIINSFFSSLGVSPKKAECDRIKNCRTVMKKRAETAMSDAPQKCKLCQTFGVCIGLVLGILLI